MPGGARLGGPLSPAADVTALYNSGVGRTYPFVGAP